MNSAPKNNTQGHVALGHDIEGFGSEWIAYSNSGHSQEVHFSLFSTYIPLFHFNFLSMIWGCLSSCNDKPFWVASGMHK